MLWDAPAKDDALGSAANYDHFISECSRMQLRGGSMGIQGEECLVSGIKWLCQTAVTPDTKGASAKGVCGTMAHMVYFRCQLRDLIQKCSHQLEAQYRHSCWSIGTV